jgi:hypothetical protein
MGNESGPLTSCYPGRDGVLQTEPATSLRGTATDEGDGRALGVVSEPWKMASFEKQRWDMMRNESAAHHFAWNIQTRHLCKSGVFAMIPILEVAGEAVLQILQTKNKPVPGVDSPPFLAWPIVSASGRKLCCGPIAGNLDGRMPNSFSDTKPQRWPTRLLAIVLPFAISAWPQTPRPRRP